MRVLLDTNVLISAILFGGTPRRALSRAIRGEVDLVTSTALLDELEDLLSGKFGFSRAAARAIRSEIEALANVIDPAHIPRICRDPDDDMVLATAVEGHVAFIVTGDDDLLALVKHEKIHIVKPAQFMRISSDDEP